MRSRTSHAPARFALLLALAAGSLGAPAWAKPAEEPPGKQIYERRYVIKQLTLHEAEVLAWDQCGKEKSELCRVRDSGVMESGILYLVFIGDDSAQERFARALADRDGVPRTQSFQIILLTADRQGKESLDALPANTRKAIEDVSGFLPFTRYRLVDAGWVRTADDASITLNGPDGWPLQVTLRFRGRVSEELFVGPFVIDAPALELSPETSPTGKRVSRVAHRLLSTTFGMKVGETLVVGTSKLDGGEEALVAVVSAAE